MRRLPTRLEGPSLIEPTVYGDERGFFLETFRREMQESLGIEPDLEFVQDNHSRSRAGVVRGMHFQYGVPLAKLVRCARGAIVDAIVDLRRGSPTFGEWESFELSDENYHQLYVPPGFAHGFCVISEVADVIYKQTDYYNPDLERGIAFDDPEVSIEWPFPRARLLPSKRDAEAPHLAELAGELPFAYQS